MSSVKSRQKQEVRVEGVKLTHPDRVVFPEQGLTKLDMARYYADIGEWILPHLSRRPLSMLRCPEGREQQCFYQKHPDSGFAKGVPRVAINEKQGGETDYLYIETVEHLIELVQFNVLEFHPWGSRIEDVEKPDTLVFDLDPGPGVTWEALLRAARDIKDRVEQLGLVPFLQTTGGKGLHVVVPIEPSCEWDWVKDFSHELAKTVARDDPKSFTTNMSKERREGRIFIDYLRNGRGNTSVVCYCARARKGAPVATPLRWDELRTLEGPDQYKVDSIQRRLSALGQDPWIGFNHSRRPLTKNMLNQLKKDEA